MKRIHILLRKQMDLKAKRDGKESLTYLDIYAKTGIATATLSNMNTSSTNALLSTIEKLCAYFDCTPGDLLKLE